MQQITRQSEVKVTCVFPRCVCVPLKSSWLASRHCASREKTTTTTATIQKAKTSLSKYFRKLYISQYYGDDEKKKNIYIYMYKKVGTAEGKSLSLKLTTFFNLN